MIKVRKISEDFVQVILIRTTQKIWQQALSSLLPVNEISGRGMSEPYLVRGVPSVVLSVR